ncbi:relaxin receptor 1-like isoform X2 [Contarinia nasturtii]|nr:relaxin receptor 1-like isoform X2 [Contarinia nasturtii]
MYHITQIAIAGKNIMVPKAFVEQTKDVYSLEINFNGLSSIDGTSICEWPKLEFLHADSNNLEKLSSGILSNCQQLTNLNLQNNKINEIASDAFFGLSSLKYLDLSSNQIKFLDKNVFEHLKVLEELDLRENQIQIDSSQLFQYNSDLRFLSLYSNDLRYIPVGLFDNLNKLEYLFISNNPNLKSNIIDLKHFDALDELMIDFTSVATLILPLNVRKVYASNSQLSRVVVQPNSQLVKLDINNTLIHNFDNFINGTLTKLENLCITLSLNDISIVEIKTKFPSIKCIGILGASSDNIDEETQRLILEAEQNKIDFAITHDDTFSRTYLYFNDFDYYTVYKKLNSTSSLKHTFLNIGIATNDEKSKNKRRKNLYTCA